MNAPTLIKRRATLYYRGEMFASIRKVEVSAYAVRVTGWAQYSSAVRFFFTRKGGRQVLSMLQSYEPDMLILAGWDHPEPAPMMGAPEVDGPVTVQRARYSSQDPRWASEFNTMINAYIAEDGIEVLADFRGWNPHTPFIGPAEATPRERYEAQEAAAAAAKAEALSTGADVAEAMAAASASLYGGSGA